MEKMYLFLICACLVRVSVTVSDEEEFSRFIKQYGRVYERGSPEYEKRFNIFKDSLERHKKLNSLSRNQYDAKFGVTKFSDMSPEEFAETVLMGSQKTTMYTHSKINISPKITGPLQIPDSYDMRRHSWPVVTPVKNQKECGGCWAFSITENLETQYALKSRDNKLYQLSVQELIDCTEGGAGCRGGNICSTVAWLNRTQLKVTTEQEYPFIDKTGICKTSLHGKVGITDYSCDRFVGNETAMVSLIANHGPLAVAVDATSWQDYLGGIIQHHCSPDDNHAVQIIGYDKTGPVPFYIVRNSWGKDWGIHGYLRIKIGDNLCGIASEVVTVTV